MLRFSRNSKSSEMRRSATAKTSSSSGSGNDTLGEIKVKKAPFRKRLIGRLNLRRSFSAPGPMRKRFHEKRPFQLRKSIGYLSSSLRGRRAPAPSPVDSEVQSQQSSAIRKSIDTISSSIRRKRCSLGAWSYEVRERRFATIPSYWSPASFRSSTKRPRRRCSLLYHSESSSGCDSAPPQLPGLDEIIARTSTESKLSTGETIGQHSCSMSIFDGLDGTSGEKGHGNLPLRLKHRNSAISSRHGETETIRLSNIVESRELDRGNVAHEDKLGGVDDTSSQQNANLNDTAETSKVPKEWIDHILETSSATRSSVPKIRLHTSDPEVLDKIASLRLTRMMQSCQPDTKRSECQPNPPVTKREKLPEMFDTLEALTSYIRLCADVDRRESKKVVTMTEDSWWPPTDDLDYEFELLRSKGYIPRHRTEDSVSSLNTNDMKHIRRLTDEDSLVTTVDPGLTDDDQELSDESIDSFLKEKGDIEVASRMIGCVL
ncbi:hypothetical protein F5B20DRAFT_587725 [Whalleya microplaca]|nr:hypothetical protein F5B20DRAFT_587725 [Whalleya microplaca]